MPGVHNFSPRSSPAHRPTGSHFDPPKGGCIWNVLLPQGWEYMTFWTLRQTRFSLLLFLPCLLRCLQETKPIYPVSVVTSILESKQEAGHKYLTWSLPTSCFRKCKQEGGCECLAWGPFESLRIKGLHIATGHSTGRIHESSWEEVGI